MKSFKFLAISIAALTMFSCAKEKNPATPDLGKPGEKAAITIKFSNPQPKAASRPVDSADAVIANCNVFLFRANGVLDSKLYIGSKPIDNKLKIVGTTTATIVYVVANTGDITDSINNEAALRATLVNLTDKADGTGAAKQTTGSVFMSGNDPVSFTAGETTAEVGVTLTFVGAKLSLEIDYAGVTAAGNGVYGTDYKIDGAFIMNAGGVSRMFGTGNEAAYNPSLIPSAAEFAASAATPYFISGETSQPTWTNMATITGVSNSLRTNFDDSTAVKAGAHFYVFEQNANTAHQAKIATILVVEATWIAGSNKKVYFPIKFNEADAARLIERSNAYNVIIKLKGDFTAGGNGGGGVENPGEDILASTVDVTITPATWTAVSVEKEFE